MKTIRITDSFFTHEYSLVKHFKDNWWVIKLKEPFPVINAFPDWWYSGVTHFLTEIKS